MYQRGLTLIELVLVIVILGVVSTGIASFVRSSMDSVTLISDRTQLMADARFAVERIQREINSAIPNSIRLYGSTSFHCLQFVPATWVSAYTRFPAAGTGDTELQIVTPLTSSGQAVTLVAGTDQAIIYPLSSADVYDSSRNKRQAITVVGSDTDANNLIELTVATGFSEQSPASRVSFAREAVSFCVSGSGSAKRLVRLSGSISATAPTSIGSGAVTIAEGLGNILSASPAVTTDGDDPFRLFQASRLRNAIVQIRLRFSDNEEEISLQREVHVANAP